MLTLTHTQHVHVWLTCFILKRCCFSRLVWVSINAIAAAHGSITLRRISICISFFFWNKNALWHECRGPAFATPYCRTMIHTSHQIYLLTIIHRHHTHADTHDTPHIDLHNNTQKRHNYIVTTHNVYQYVDSTIAACFHRACSSQVHHSFVDCSSSFSFRGCL